MAYDFDAMKTYIGEYVDNTDGSFKTKIGKDINRLYEEVWREIDWTDGTDDDYTFESVADQQLYDLPSDFEKPVYMVNINTGKIILPYKIAEYWREEGTDYSEDTTQSGTTSRYVILEESGKFKLSPTPDTAETYAFPYKKQFVSLSDDTDVVAIQGMDRILELGAISMAYGRLEQHSKSDLFNQKYLIALHKRIVQERQRANYRFQRTPEKRWWGRSIERLTGDIPYDGV